MSNILAAHRRKFIFGGVVTGLLVVSPYASFPNVFHTPGVANIEDRYSAGGGSRNHTPGAATQRGDPDQVVGNTTTPQGIGSPQWQERIGGQKPDPSSVRKKWNEAHYNAEKGK